MYIQLRLFWDSGQSEFQETLLDLAGLAALSPPALTSGRFLCTIHLRVCSTWLFPIILTHGHFSCEIPVTFAFWWYTMVLNYPSVYHFFSIVYPPVAS
jgi:hypothetical protein